MIVSGSDDATIGLWDVRTKEAVDYMEARYPVTAVTINEAGTEIYSGGIENEINVII